MDEVGKVLLVEDQKEVIQWIGNLLKPHVELLDIATSPCQLPKKFKENSYDVILLSLIYNDILSNGDAPLKVMHHILKHDETAQVIFMVRKGDVDKVIDVMKAGAADAIEGPLQNECLLHKVKAAIRKRVIHQLEEQDAVNDIEVQPFVFRSDIMSDIVHTIEKVAPSEANVLIVGENGTGKELVAQAIHQQSLRKDKLFMSVDMGVFNESLFENELFGHAKGAYTDAKHAMPGRFELANGGTVFLDEISNLGLAMQAKLLTVLERRQISRIGESTSRDVDVRFVFATNKGLREMVDKGEFRQDLLYRMNTVEIELPPLRERREDIEVLADYFLKDFCDYYHKGQMFINQGAIKCLQDYHWPGNVRELQHVIEKGVIMAEGKVLTKKDLCTRHNDFEGETFLFENFRLEDIERKVINKVLRKYAGNLTHSAEALGLTRASLYRRLKKYQL
jgi:DNA-binding NtrC family response regulator